VERKAWVLDWVRKKVVTVWGGGGYRGTGTREKRGRGVYRKSKKTGRERKAGSPWRRLFLQS